MLRLGALILALGLAACSLSQPIARQAIDFNGTVEVANNAVLVRNVLRARDNAPLFFTTLPQIRGSLSVGVTSPGAFGPAGAGAQNGAGLGVQALTSPSFDVAALDAQEFTRGLLEPISGQIFRYFAERGISEQLLSLLLLESVTDEATGERVVNDPRCWFERPDCPTPAAPAKIERAFLTMTGEGRYYFHAYTALTPIGPPLAAARASDPALVALLDDKRRLLPAGPGRWQLFRAETREAVCRRSNLGGRPRDQECVALEMVEQPRTAGLEARTAPGVQVQLRSVSEIYRFLGAVLRVQETIPLAPDQRERCLAFPVRPRPGGGPPLEACLFHATRDDREVLPAGVAFTVEHNGETYRVPAYAEPTPERRGDYTLRVMALLTDLLNLQKTSTAIPTTRAVQLVR